MLVKESLNFPNQAGLYFVGRGVEAHPLLLAISNSLSLHSEENLRLNKVTNSQGHRILGAWSRECRGCEQRWWSQMALIQTLTPPLNSYDLG